MSGQWPPEWEDVDGVFGAEHDQPAAEEDARQAEVAAYLASVPAPVLPEGIASRISAAIAAEAASRAASGLQVATGDHEAAGTSEAQAAPGASSASRNGAGEGSGGTGDGGAGGARPVGPVPARARVRRPRSGPRRSGLRRGRGRWFMLIGPLVAFLVVGGLAYALTITASPTDSSSAPAGAAAGAAGSASSAARSGAAAGSAASAGGIATAPPRTGGQSPAHVSPANPGPAATPLFTVTESGTKYRQASLTGQVRATLAHTVQGSRPFSTVPQTPTLAGCVLHLTGGQPPRLVDLATYQGKPAYVIADSGHVWVAGTGCTKANPELVASVPLAG